MWSRLVLVSLLAVVATAACGPSVSGSDFDARTGGKHPDASVFFDAPPFGTPDATMIDGKPGNFYDDGGAKADGPPGCIAPTCTTPVDDACQSKEECGPDGTGNGLDDDCNGLIDDGCTCVPGAVESCFRGPPGRHNVGACQDGQATCTGATEFGQWGACVGGISPKPEACDSTDNDCNGCVDDDPSCCTVALQCPTSMPDALPFQAYPINGTNFYGGPATSWTWTVTGGPCDEDVFKPNTGMVSYTVSGANSSNMSFTPVLSGDYTITMDAKDGSADFTCTFIVHVKGPGVRVELCWDKTGPSGSDFDLHVHRPGTTTPWFDSLKDSGQDGVESTGTGASNDDCHYMNCKAQPFLSGATTINWGYPNTTPDTLCAGGPSGSDWAALGYCRNPRLDIDNIDDVAEPENINIDAPATGESFRVMAHYFGINDFFSSSVTQHPMVNVYCGGHLKATYGASPNFVPGFDMPDPNTPYGEGPMWRVADVAVTGVDSNGDTTCDVTAIHPPSQTTGYYVTIGDRTY